MHPAAWIQHAKQTDRGYLNRHVEMLVVRYQVFKTATIQRTAVKYPYHLYLTGLPFNHVVHNQATHRHLLQQEHVRKMESGLELNRRAFQVCVTNKVKMSSMVYISCNKQSCT